MTELIRKSSLWVVILFLSQRILLLICMVMQFMWTTNKNFLLPRKYLKKTLWILTIFDWLYFIQCLTFFSSTNHFLCLFCSAFDAISSNINGVLSVNPSANMFVFGDFNTHIRTVWPILVELNDLVHSVIIFLFQMTILRWLTFIIGSLTVTLTVLLFWVYSFFLLWLFVLPWLSSNGKFWLCCCFSFHWISVKLKMGCTVSSHSL